MSLPNAVTFLPLSPVNQDVTLECNVGFCDSASFTNQKQIACHREPNLTTTNVDIGVWQIGSFSCSGNKINQFLDVKLHL